MSHVCSLMILLLSSCLQLPYLKVLADSTSLLLMSSFKLLTSLTNAVFSSTRFTKLTAKRTLYILSPPWNHGFFLIAPYLSLGQQSKSAVMQLLDCALSLCLEFLCLELWWLILDLRNLGETYNLLYSPWWLISETYHVFLPILICPQCIHENPFLNYYFSKTI